MRTYLLKRLLLIVPTLLGAAALVFVIMRVIPGDVALLIFGGDQAGNIDPKQLAAMRHRLGLDQPMLVQFGDVAVGRAPLRLRHLAVDGTARRRGAACASAPDPSSWPSSRRSCRWCSRSRSACSPPCARTAGSTTLIRVVSIGGLAIPSFWVGILIILLLVIYFGWGPPLEFTPPWVDPWANFQQMVWPVLTVGYRYAAVTTRMTRSTVLEVMREDYIRTAWAKGLQERVVVIRHALKNAMLPVITLIGTEFAFLIGGLVVTETVFTLNGVGRFVVDAVAHRDYPVVQALVFLIALGFVVVNLLIDLAYAWFDPRIRYR